MILVVTLVFNLSVIHLLFIISHFKILFLLNAYKIPSFFMKFNSCNILLFNFRTKDGLLHDVSFVNHATINSINPVLIAKVK